MYIQSNIFLIFINCPQSNLYSTLSLFIITVILFLCSFKALTLCLIPEYRTFYLLSLKLNFPLYLNTIFPINSLDLSFYSKKLYTTNITGATLPSPYFFLTYFQNLNYYGNGVKFRQSCEHSLNFGIISSQSILWKKRKQYFRIRNWWHNV